VRSPLRHRATPTPQRLCNLYPPHASSRRTFPAVNRRPAFCRMFRHHQRAFADILLQTVMTTDGWQTPRIAAHACHNTRMVFLWMAPARTGNCSAYKVRIPACNATPFGSLSDAGSRMVEGRHTYHCTHFYRTYSTYSRRLTPPYNTSVPTPAAPGAHFRSTGKQTTTNTCDAMLHVGGSAARELALRSSTNTGLVTLCRCWR